MVRMCVWLLILLFWLIVLGALWEVFIDWLDDLSERRRERRKTIGAAFNPSRLDK